MKYYAEVIDLNEDIEEEVLLSFGEIELYCFIASCTYELTKGNIYLVDIEFSFLDDEVIEPQPNSDFSIVRKKDGFAYEITGFKINDKIIVDTLVFSDRLYSQEYAYINYEHVLIKPDRISVSFL